MFLFLVHFARDIFRKGLNEELKVKALELWEDTALQLKGSERRQFMAKVVNLLGRANFCRKELGLARSMTYNRKINQLSAR